MSDQVGETTPRKKEKKSKKSKKDRSSAAGTDSADVATGESSAVVDSTDNPDSDARTGRDERDTEDRRGANRGGDEGEDASSAMKRADNNDTPGFGMSMNAESDASRGNSPATTHTRDFAGGVSAPGGSPTKGKGKQGGAPRASGGRQEAGSPGQHRNGMGQSNSADSFPGRAGSPDSDAQQWGRSESYDEGDPDVYAGSSALRYAGGQDEGARVQAGGGDSGTSLPQVGGEARASKHAKLPQTTYKKQQFDRTQSNAIRANKISAAQPGGSVASPRHRNMQSAKSPRAAAYLRKKSPQKPELAKWITNPAKLSLHDFLQAQIKLTKSWLVYNEAEMKVTEEKICRTILKGLSSQLPHVDNPPAGFQSKKVHVTSPDTARFHHTPRGPKPNGFSEGERMTILLKPVKRCDPKIWRRIEKGLQEAFSYYARADVTLDPMLMDEAVFWATRRQWEMFCHGFDLEVVTGISMSDLIEFYGPSREPVDFGYFLELIGEVAVKTLEWWLEKPIDSINLYAEPDGQVALGRLAEILGFHDEHKSFRQYLRGRQNIRPMMGSAASSGPKKAARVAGGAAERPDDAPGQHPGGRDKRGSEFLAGGFRLDDGDDMNAKSTGHDTSFAPGEEAPGAMKTRKDARTKQQLPAEPSAMRRSADDMED